MISNVSLEKRLNSLELTSDVELCITQAVGRACRLIIMDGVVPSATAYFTSTPENFGGYLLVMVSSSDLLHVCLSLVHA